MNKKMLEIFLYGSVFSTAYAGFFYQKQVDAGVHHDTARIRPAPSETVASIADAPLRANAYKASSRYQTSSQPDNKPSASVTAEKGRRQKDRKKTDNKIRRDSAELHHTERNTQAITSSAASSNFQRDYSYGQNQAEPAGSAEQYTGPAALAYVATPATYSSASKQTTTTVSTVSTSGTPATVNTGTSSDTSSQNNIINEDISTVDGSEFLPDGSSQQDLFESLSKKPRVYTIEDYQKADISCAPAYSTPTAHAELIYALKGC